MCVCVCVCVCVCLDCENKYFSKHYHRPLVIALSRVNGGERWSCQTRYPRVCLIYIPWLLLKSNVDVITGMGDAIKRGTYGGCSHHGWQRQDLVRGQFNMEIVLFFIKVINSDGTSTINLDWNSKDVQSVPASLSCPSSHVLFSDHNPDHMSFSDVIMF